MIETIVKITGPVEKQQAVLKKVKTALGQILRDRNCTSCNFIWRNR